MYCKECLEKIATGIGLNNKTDEKKKKHRAHLAEEITERPEPVRLGKKKNQTYKNLKIFMGIYLQSQKEEEKLFCQ